MVASSHQLIHALVDLVTLVTSYFTSLSLQTHVEQNVIWPTILFFDGALLAFGNVRRQCHALLGQLAPQPALRRYGHRAAGSCINGVSHTKTVGEETHEGDQGDSEFTNLLDDALCCAIGSRHDDPVVSLPDIEDTTNCLQNVDYEK